MLVSKKVLNPAAACGPGEFDWGAGIEGPLSKGTVRSTLEQHRAVYRTDTLDAASDIDLTELERKPN